MRLTLINRLPGCTPTSHFAFFGSFCRGFVVDGFQNCDYLITPAGLIDRAIMKKLIAVAAAAIT